VPQYHDDLFSDAFETRLKDYLAEPSGPSRDALRNELVANCMPYVQKLARGLARRGNDPVDDLVQVGYMGLMKAIDKFNPLAGSSFKTYATYLITGEIRHYLRDKSSIIKAPRQMYELYYRINQIVQRLTDDLGRTPTDIEIAEELECPVHHVQDASIVDRRRTMISLDQFVTGADGTNGETMYIERLVDTKYFEFLQNQEDKLLLENALVHLKEELRQVIQLTYYEDMSQTEIAKHLGISQMQVSRRLRKALDILYGVLHNEHVDVV
jgi:RNA polymerase sigma-B factor